MCKCTICGEEFNLDEMVGVNCNGHHVPVDAQSLELNAQNPDYCVAKICLGCADADENKSITIKENEAKILFEFSDDQQEMIYNAYVKNHTCKTCGHLMSYVEFANLYGFIGDVPVECDSCFDMYAHKTLYGM